MFLVVLLTDLSPGIDTLETIPQTSLSDWSMTDQPYEGHHCSSGSGSPHSVSASPPGVKRQMQVQYFFVILFLSRPNRFASST